MTLICESCGNRIVITVPKDCEHRVEAFCHLKHLKPHRMVVVVATSAVSTNPQVRDSRP